MTVRVRRQPGDWSQSGAMGIVMLAVLCALGLLFGTGLTIGYLLMRHQQAQNATDAVAVADGLGVLENPLTAADSGAGPLPGWVNADLAEQLVAANAAFTPRIDQRGWGQSCSDGRAWSQPTVADSGVWDVPAAPGGVSAYRVTSRAQVYQNCFPLVEPLRPQLMLVIDFSASMRLGFQSDPSQRAIDVLRNAVRNLLDQNLPIDIGAVLYSDDPIFSRMPQADTTEVRNQLNTAPQGDGNLGAGIDRALQEFRNRGNTQPSPCLRDAARYMLIVTDGAPRVPPGTVAEAEARGRAQAEQQARLAREANAVTIATIEVRRVNSSADYTDFLIGISGRHDTLPADRPLYYRAVENAAELTASIAQQATDVFCTTRQTLHAYTDEPIGPTWPAYPYVFSDFAGESAVPVATQRSQLEIDFTTDPPTRPLAAYFDRVAGCILLSNRACQPFLNGQADSLRVRFGWPRLVCVRDDC